MKLKSVKILGDGFRSLAGNKLYEFNLSEGKERLSTKIFAGLNGSGKSNFLELFSEIFYYLELYHLESVGDEEKSSKNIGFEIEYFLPMVHLPLGMPYFKWQVDTDAHVRIVKPLGERPEFSIKKYGEADFTRIDEATEFLLPTKVIAYTSGQNELLSNPYYKLKYHYFKEFSKKKKKEDNGALADNHRLFFLDYNTNFSIFVANMLLADRNKIEYLKKVLVVNELRAFRITINLVDINKKVIPFSVSLADNVNKLKLCATTWIEKKEGKEHLLIIDYLVNDATKSAFEFHFKKAYSLFSVFYELEILNLFLIKRDTRDLMLQVHKSYNFSDELPQSDPSRLVFRIEKIEINKIIDERRKTARNIFYKALSDGEHQFNEVIGTVLMMEDEGCLFLMDEPDTHFNPLWRAKMIKMLNYVAATSIDSSGRVTKVRNQEIIITTHSPFVISDSQPEDVYKFEKIDGQVHYNNPKHIETYGASIGLILKEIFNRKLSISDLANYDIEELRNAFKGLKDPELIKQKIEETKDKLLNFGESIEKFDLYSFLREMEKQIQK